VELESVLDAVCSRRPGCRRDVLEAALRLVLEIVCEGHEGRPAGTLLTIGRATEVLRHSRLLILDPLAGHEPASTRITDGHLRGTLKQLSQLDGAFVMADDGTVVSACRYLDVPAAGIDLPLGLGSRHVAAASVSKWLGIVSIVASASGTVRVFCEGEPVATLYPPQEFPSSRSHNGSRSF
jgi:diadenylate cyclase